MRFLFLFYYYYYFLIATGVITGAWYLHNKSITPVANFPFVYFFSLGHREIEMGGGDRERE